MKQTKTKTLKLISKVLLFVCVLAVSSFGVIASGSAQLSFDFHNTDLSSIKVDLYKVADENGTLTEAFKDLSLKDSTGKEYTGSVLAENAVELIEKNSIEPTMKQQEVTTTNPSINLDEGYYLYVVEDAQSDAYDYEFNPGLVKLTSETEAIDISLKATRKDRTGSIKITKTLSSWNETSNECTFVFEIKAEKDGKVVYSNVASISFNEANHGSDSVEVTGIPVGSTVTVTEVYSGGYTQTSVTPESKTLVLDQEITFDFTNDYNDYRKSYGVENQFSFDTEWHWHAKDITGNVKGETE